MVAGLGRQVRYVLGDTHYNDPELRELCEKRGKFLIATQTDSSRKKQKENGGNEVRKIFHQLRSHSIENFNEHFKSIFNVHASVPTKGLAKTRLWILGCVYVYQLTLLCRHQNGQALRRGFKAFLKAA